MHPSSVAIVSIISPDSSAVCAPRWAFAFTEAALVGADVRMHIGPHFEPPHWWAAIIRHNASGLMLVVLARDCITPQGRLSLRFPVSPPWTVDSLGI